MKPLALGIGSAVAGAAIAAALIYALPALTPGSGAETDNAAAAEAPPAEEGVVQLAPSAMAHAAIRVVTLEPARIGVQRSGFARALDVSTLSAIDAEIRSARAALAASEADYTRQRALAAEDQSAATRAVETARAQAQADRARLTAAVQRIGLEFGPGLAGFAGAPLSELVRAIAAGDASLIRVDFTDGPAARGARVRIGDRDTTSATVTLLGAAAATDPRLQTAGSLAIVRGPLARLLGAGRVLPASVAASGTEAGILVPREAILRFQGGLWVYHVVPGGFARAELIDARPEANGWFVKSGVAPGEKVAAGGIGVLLSLERGGTAAEDE